MSQFTTRTSTRTSLREKATTKPSLFFDEMFMSTRTRITEKELAREIKKTNKQTSKQTNRKDEFC